MLDGAVGAADSVWFALGNSPLLQNYSGEFSQSVGSYNVVATDLGGCMSSINIVVEGPDEVEITLSATGDLGDSSGIGTATATGGSGDYTYEWVDSSRSLLGAFASFIILFIFGRISATNKDGSTM